MIKRRVLRKAEPNTSNYFTRLDRNVAIPPHVLKIVGNATVSRLQPRQLRTPVRRQLQPSRAFTGGMLPVNMCGPVPTARCNWLVQHTPPQAPTAPHSPPTEGNVSREDAPFKTMTQGWRENEKGGGVLVEGKTGKRSLDLGKENLDQTGFML